MGNIIDGFYNHSYSRVNKYDIDNKLDEMQDDIYKTINVYDSLFRNHIFNNEKEIEKLKLKIYQKIDDFETFNSINYRTIEKCQVDLKSDVNSLGSKAIDLESKLNVLKNNLKNQDKRVKQLEHKLYSVGNLFQNNDDCDIGDNMTGVLDNDDCDIGDDETGVLENDDIVENIDIIGDDISIIYSEYERDNIDYNIDDDNIDDDIGAEDERDNKYQKSKYIHFRDVEDLKEDLRKNRDIYKQPETIS